MLKIKVGIKPIFYCKGFTDVKYISYLYGYYFCLNVIDFSQTVKF